MPPAASRPAIAISSVFSTMVTSVVLFLGAISRFERPERAGPAQPVAAAGCHDPTQQAVDRQTLVEGDTGALMECVHGHQCRWSAADAGMDAPVDDKR